MRDKKTRDKMGDHPPLRVAEGDVWPRLRRQRRVCHLHSFAVCSAKSPGRCLVLTICKEGSSSGSVCTSAPIVNEEDSRLAHLAERKAQASHRESNGTGHQGFLWFGFYAV